MYEGDIIMTQKFAPCTPTLKLKPIREYIKALHNFADEIIMYIGFDLADKRRGRLPKPKKNWATLGIKVEYPLVDELIINPESELRDLGLTPPRTYSMGYKHANCIGQRGCVKFGQKDMIKILEHFPERYAKREKAENEIRARQIAKVKHLTPMCVIQHLQRVQSHSLN